MIISNSEPKLTTSEKRELGFTTYYYQVDTEFEIAKVLRRSRCKQKCQFDTTKTN